MMPPTRSPLRCAELLLTLSPTCSAEVVLALDARFAVLVLRTVNGLSRESFEWTDERCAAAEAARCLLMIRCGLDDHCLRTARELRFAAGPELHRALERVAKARLRELAPR